MFYVVYFAVRLKDNKRYSEAAVLFEHYAKVGKQGFLSFLQSVTSVADRGVCIFFTSAYKHSK